ncbi:Cation channel sperm-associated protein subunit gamma 1 [Orchesella cincta]|uniref:Cation channel sperm-associated protein subunit gamma 1 n=1 Tax=Orchesella cincta TaxID=48709 RepID=A0A1D2MJK7_ORCCI|nr:Cation channel sperm-associated protein subunit gamma 1 [Orchesella cincta]
MRPKHRRGESLYIAAAIIEIEGEKRLEELKDLAPSPVTDPFGVISQPGFQYPCEYKCESDPLYWTCVAECYERDPTALWDSQCYKTNLCNSSAPNHLLRGRCLPCLTQSTLDQLQKTCEIAYLPNSAPGINNLCIEMERCINKVPTPGSPGGGVNRTIRECAMDPQVQNRKELMQLCVTDTIMSAQRDCCYSEPVREASLCKTNNHKCDEFCDRILSPRLCQATCKKIRDEAQHECLENTCTFDYPISKVPCVHCLDSSLLTLKTHVEACTFPFCIRNLTTTKETYLTDNCHNLDWIQRFASFLKTKLNINNDIWAKVEVEKMDWITSHFTPIECFNDSMTDPLKGCAEDYLTTKRDSPDILAKCESNPYRILDMLVCGLHQEESLSWMNVLNQRNKFTGIRCKNEKLTLEVYKLVFQYEEKVCDDYCAKSKIRPENVASMKCRLEQCLVKEENLKVEHRKHCKPLEDAYLVQVSDFAPCRWQVDFAKSSNPYVLYATYFNELGPSEIRDKLEHPDTTGILQETDVNGKEGFYTFPYFVVVRVSCCTFIQPEPESLCDDNGYYDDGAYRFFVVGGNPIVELKYTAPTSRHSPTTLIHGVFQSSLVKLNSKGNDELIPLNPGSVDEEGNGCHEKICHPGFVVPLILLNIPQETMYVSAFHSRAVEGKGEIQIATSDYPAHAGMLFPKKRSSIFTDIELSFHSSCFANDLSDSTSEGYKKLKCSELDHILDEFDHPYETNIFAPLDAEDMLRSQYTYDNRTVQAIAGFYDPRFLVIGDPDMNDFEVVNWGKLLKPLEKDTSLHSCIQQDLVHKGYPKPIYSQIDRTDPDYPIYYRQRYAGRVYYDEKANKKSKEEDLPETAVFEAIALEDRLLLVTTKGLVSVYGHTNATVATNRQWTFSTDPARQDQIDRCFKLVRVLRRAQPNSDTIVGITYDYRVRNPTTKELEEVTQQVWVGKFTYPGQNIEWSKVEAVSVDNNIESHRVLDGAEAKSPGDPVLFDPVKQPGLPLQIREANPKSPIETICYKTYRTVIQPVAPRATVYDDRGWCQVIDATPEVMKELTIQVLVRFRLMYNEEGRDIIPVYFYILATHTLKQNSSVGFWRIDAVIPRKPCLDQHHESIKNTFLFDKTYFIHKTVGTGQEYGCYDDGNRKEKYIDSYVYLTGMTYTRHAKTIIKWQKPLCSLYAVHQWYCTIRLSAQKIRYELWLVEQPQVLGVVEVFHREVHRIMLMAFNDKGHYAFLTNKLELWVGNTGSLELILLRPSPLRGMVQLGLSKVRNLHDGVPFSIHFDSSDSLYEMVAIVGKEGHVTRIMKRPATEWKLLRVQQRAKDKAAGLSKELQMSFNYDSSMWANTCPFSSPKLSQNFSSTNSRTQGMYFPNPRQHLKLGKAYIEASLMTFQAATFSLVWKSFYNVPIRYYTGKDKDAFELYVFNKYNFDTEFHPKWIDKKRDMAILGVLQFGQGEPEDTGIVVQPRKFKRLQSYGNSSNLENSYYIDYNQVAELRLEFSSKNDFMVLNTDYEAQEINAIQLNVENANGSIIQVNTDKVFEAHRAVVVFFVRISVKRKTGLSQNLPGEHLLPVPMTFHFIGAFGNCIKNRANGIIGDSVETVAYVGCPPSRDFVFNWKSTLKSLKFRSGDTNHGTGDMCHGHEFACFFSRNPLVLFFDIFDESKQKFIPYTGKYTLRIIAGGRTKDEMRMFTDEEIQGYNVPGISDVSLIWNEWDITRHQKVERKPQTLYDDDGQEVHRDSREVILESGKSTILWACHTLSPCARVRPTWNLEVIFWFRLQITNRDVDNDTLCLYEKEIDIMLYGFNPSPEFQLFSTLGFCFFLLTILYICYRCCRRHQYLWRATKVNVRSWIRITKEVFPKKIRKYEPPLPEEVLERRQKVHRGFGSQDITHGDDDSNASLVDADSQEGGNKAHSSASSVGSLSTSMADSSQILPDNRPQYLPLSAKGVVYDQILTRRLNSIVERNRAMRQNLIRKASIQLKVDDLETEAHFEAQFGRTVSQESVFTPPMPKDRKRGVDNFFF